MQVQEVGTPRELSSPVSLVRLSPHFLFRDLLHGALKFEAGSRIKRARGLPR